MSGRRGRRAWPGVDEDSAPRSIEMAVVLLGGARLPRTTGPPTDLEEGIGAPVSARKGAHPNQVIGDQLLEESRQADAAFQGQSFEPAELGRIEPDVRRHPGHSS